MSILPDIYIINMFLTLACPIILLMMCFDEQNILILI